MIQFQRVPGFERFDFRRIPLHRFLIRIYELVRRYGLYVGVLPSLIALILPEKYFYISIPLLLFAILLDSLSFYYGRIPEELVAFARLLRYLRRAFWRHSFCIRKLLGDSVSSSGGEEN